MFDFILYPVSAILWFWHLIFGAVLGADNGFAWALAVFFLVFSLRLVLLKPAASQLRAARRMQKFAPQLQKLREKYRNDRQHMMREMQKLQTEYGFSPLGGLLPAMLQIPVFLSLVTVLRGFTSRGHSNYVFGEHWVASFTNADVFGAKLGNWISQSPEELLRFGTDRAHMLAVGVPLMVVASVATYLTMRMSLRRQSTDAAANPQTAMLSKAMMYLAPVGMLVSGLLFPMPIGVLLYFLANNVWTFGQQHFLTAKIDREQREEERRALEVKAATPPRAPKPGKKPVTRRPKKRR